MNVEAYLDAYFENYPSARHLIAIVLVADVLALIIIHFTTGIILSTIGVIVVMTLGFSLLMWSLERVQQGERG